MLKIGFDIGGTSIKAAALRGDQVLWKRQSAMYRKPSFADLQRAMHEVCPEPIDEPVVCGLCLPGLLDPVRRRITIAVNAPGLIETDLDKLLGDSVGTHYKPATIVNDAVAAGTDVVASRKMNGRVHVIAMGTGVGSSIVDNGKATLVEIGQIDVSVEGHPVIGPDGGAGGLEGYVGANVLRDKYGPDLEKAAANFKGDEPELIALARSIRIIHAMYRPHHTVLCGGVGIRLKPALHHIERLVKKNLTSVAREDWTLSIGDHDFHSALGSARLAATA